MLQGARPGLRLAIAVDSPICGPILPAAVQPLREQGFEATLLLGLGLESWV